ncbi:Adenine-specific methyltransferase activity [Flavobacterium sp. 9AF]|uniref:HsdM family class I SAM-dependent methyltransferase n=1 Tax=Flavobacterium sp. 9AF TaxID=2653142 RepID=UPI0012F348C4|nr:N-6 DNA methylase [Flavobacterium sp. 9AF]VXB18562.1 Adenine-specific methyltransferase activity [Flavobacterium sp. 9AF]
MSKKEKNLDIFISKLLDNAKIKYSADGSSIKEINDALKTASKKGTGRVGFPEFVGISNDFIIVIEDKAELDKQANYSDEDETKLATDVKSLKDFAENGALHYGKHIVENTNFKRIFAFGCSGDEKHHIIRPIFIDQNGYKLLKPVENFENFSTENIEKYYKEQVLEETPAEILEKDALIAKAKELHEFLRNYGQLGDDEKPLVVSAILLALSDPNFKTENLTGDTVRTDGQKIFSAIEDYMKRVEVTPDTKKEKVLNQFNIIKDRTLLNQVDDRLKNKNQKEELAKTPLKFFTEFVEKNILASVKANTSEDVLGLFYGEFIRFSGGDGQTLGVVLTPSHITDIFCDLIDLNSNDRVFDPCCGTSAFLISALHKMLKQVKTKEEQDNIKKNQLHGIEIREDMFSIATTNMILRGDGKSNLENKDFLKVAVSDLRRQNYSVGFMNPPYSQAKGKDTAHLSEIHFIEHLLDGLADNGRCVIIIPQSTMVGKTSEDKKVKKRILSKHTLEGVITLNKETFYGVGTNPCIAIFTAHKPHSEKKFCKFINYEDDGFVIRKHVGLVETERAKERKAHLLNCWLHDAPAETKFMVKTTIDPEDEWLHSFYYFNDEIPKVEDFENTIADYLTFEFNMMMQGKSYLFENTK